MKAKPRVRTQAEALRTVFAAAQLLVSTLIALKVFEVIG